MYSKFLDLKHSIQKELRKSYWQYINNLISPESSHHGYQQQKKFWSYIRSLKRDHTEISSLYTPDGLVTDNIEKAEALNVQFKSVFTTEPNQPLPDKGASPCPIMSNISITVTGIVNLLRNLDIHKATGPDEISARVFKELNDIYKLKLIPVEVEH